MAELRRWRRVKVDVTVYTALATLAAKRKMVNNPYFGSENDTQH